MKKIIDNSLYLVLTEECCKGRPAAEIAEAAIAGDVDIIQMREKAKKPDELVKLGCALRGICKKGREGNRREEKGDVIEKGNVIFIINDDPVLAKEIGADGVHLGQEDLVNWSIKKARGLLGPGKIIGISTHSIEQVKKAVSEDVDYIAFGPIYKTKTKNYFIGTADIGEVLKIASKPVFFIGGINLGNIDELLVKGAKNIALIRGITESEDVESAARSFKIKIAAADKKG